MGGVSTRRDFLRLAAGGAVCAAVAAAQPGCSSGKGKSTDGQTAAPATKTGARPTQLRIAQVGHFVPGYDAWFDHEYTKAWGERNGIEVIVDHLPIGELSARAAAEANTKRGHDLFGFFSSPAAFEDDVIDLSDVAQEIEGKVGKASVQAERSTFNPKTKKRFGICDYFAPSPVHYRRDLWAGVGTLGRPDTWNDLLVAGPPLKAGGHPPAVDMSQNLDGNLDLIALLQSYGAPLQDEDGVPAFDRPATVEAVKIGTTLWAKSLPPEALVWNDPAANNRYLADGRASLIMNPVSALRAVEKQDPAVARSIALGPALAGPAGRFFPVDVSVYVVWKFAANQEAAKRFLVDLVAGYREAFVASEFYNWPGYPGSVPNLADLVANVPGAEPVGKYALLAQAPEWSTNVGHPGPTNAVVDEVFTEFLIPKMFAAAARGEMTAEAAVAATAAQMRTIYDRWRERGKV